MRFGIMRNHWLIGGLALSILLQAAVSYWAPLNRLFHTVPMPLANLLPLLAIASSVLWVEELQKWVVRLQRGSPASYSRTTALPPEL